MNVKQVVAAVIVRDGQIFATARGYGTYRGFWEFPGGKVEPGETPREALVREIREELDISIEVGPLLSTVEFDYPDFHLSMGCYLCRITEGEPILKEALEARWLTKDALSTVAWLPADESLIERLAESDLSF